jgi:hypothetical protein
MLTLFGLLFFIEQALNKNLPVSQAYMGHTECVHKLEIVGCCFIAS